MSKIIHIILEGSKKKPEEREGLVLLIANGIARLYSGENLLLEEEVSDFDKYWKSILLNEELNIEELLGYDIYSTDKIAVILMEGRTPITQDLLRIILEQNNVRETESIIREIFPLSEPSIQVLTSQDYVQNNYIRASYIASQDYIQRTISELPILRSPSFKLEFSSKVMYYIPPRMLEKILEEFKLEAFGRELLRFFSVEHSELFLGLTSILPVGREMEVESLGPCRARFIGTPESILWALSIEYHEVAHQFELMHGYMMGAYASTEAMIYGFRKLVSQYRDEYMLKKFAKETRKNIYFHPLRIEEDVLDLLEALALDIQGMIIRFPEVYGLDIGEEETRRIFNKFLESIKKSRGHRSAWEFFTTFEKKIMKRRRVNPAIIGTILQFFACFTDFDRKKAWKYLVKILDDKSMVRGLERMSELDSFDRLDYLIRDLTFFDYEKYRSEILNILKKTLGVCNEDFANRRVRMVKELIENSRKPSDLIIESGKWHNIIVKSQDGRIYITTPSSIGVEEYVCLAVSFFSDLIIYTNILSSLELAFRSGMDPWKSMEKAVRCPLRDAPMLECKDKDVCKHEEPWIESIRT
jgi:hypothetical protein